MEHDERQDESPSDRNKRSQTDIDNQRNHLEDENLDQDDDLDSPQNPRKRTKKTPFFY